MALETIIKRENEEKPMMVDVPVIVEKKEETEVEAKKTFVVPRKWMIIGISGFVLLIVLISILLRISSNRPDLEINVPSNLTKNNPTVIESEPGAIATVSSSLSDIPYSNPLEGFEISPPSGWLVDDTRKTSAAVIFISPVGTIIDGKSYATLISIETKSAVGVGLADQVSEIKKGIFEAFPDFTIEDDLQVYIEGRPYYLIGGTYTVNGVQVRRRSLILLYNNRGYAISATGPTSVWGDYDSIITSSMYSFKLI